MNLQDSHPQCKQIARTRSPTAEDECLADSNDPSVISNIESWTGSAKFEQLQKPTVAIVREVSAIYEKNKPSSTQGIVASIFETYDRLVEEYRKYRTASVS